MVRAIAGRRGSCLRHVEMYRLFLALSEAICNLCGVELTEHSKHEPVAPLLALLA